MIDTTLEQPIPLSKAARETPNRKGGRGVNVATVWRWTQRGVRGVKLETIMVGGMRMTTREAMQRFFQPTTAAADSASTPARTPKQRQKAIRRAEAELAEAGI